MEKGILEWRLLCVVVSLWRNKDKLPSLQAMRKKLQSEVRKLVDDLKPQLGKEWEEEKETLSRLSEDTQDPDDRPLEWRTTDYYIPPRSKTLHNRKRKQG